MKFARRSFLGAAMGGALTVALPSFAQSAGKDYTPISPVQPTEDAGKIEVLEFFSYGCPHCAEFNPLVVAWAAKLPADVVFKKVPITFGRAAWANISRLYYTLDITGDLARLESEVFKAIHVERVNLFDERTLTEWVAKKGVDTKKFADTFKSFGLTARSAVPTRWRKPTRSRACRRWRSMASSWLAARVSTSSWRSPTS
nr:thiol:disulfide interchange protein DsbA/DsbL [Dechloromonas sp. A34]